MTGSTAGVSRLVVALAVAGALGVGAWESVRTTTSVRSASSVTGWNDIAVQTTCLRHAVMHAVPKGSLVWVGPATSINGDRLAEVSTLWAVPAPDEQAARFTFTLVPVGGGCEGLELRVRTLP